MTATVAAPPAAAGSSSSRVHRLAEGTELIGEYQGSGLQQPKYLVRRSDDQVMQLPSLLYRVAASLDGVRSDDEVAEGLSRELDDELTGENVRFLVEERLRPAGIIAADGAAGASEAETTPAPVRPDPLLALRYRVGVVPPSVAWRIAGVFGPLFRRSVWAVALAAFLALDVAIVLQGQLVDRAVAGVTDVVRQPSLTLVMLALTLLGAAFHESGHVAACRYGGARPGDMGFGIYLVWPALYSTVTDAYRLDRTGRLRTDLGGVYFNAIFMAGIGAAYLATDQHWLLLLLYGLHVETAWQFLPSIRLDGYYMLADLIGVPELFGYLKPVLVSLLPGRPTHPKVHELKTWSRRVIVGWVVAVIPTLGFYLVVFLTVLPRVLPAVWDALVEYGHALDAAVRAGGVTDVVLGVSQLFFLVLPWIGTALIVWSFGPMLRRSALGRWCSTRVPATAWPAIRRAGKLAVLATLGGLVVARVTRVAASLPASTGETRVTVAAVEGIQRTAAGTGTSVSEVLLSRLLAGYAGLTGAFGRHPGVLQASRELAVLATAVLVVCVAVFAVQGRVRPLALGLSLLAVAVIGPAVSALAFLSPAVVGAVWAAVGLLLVTRYWSRHRRRSWDGGTILGVVAIAVGIAVAPLVAVPLAGSLMVLLVQARVWSDRAAAARAAAMLGLLAGAALGVYLSRNSSAPLDAADHTVLLLVALPLVIGGCAVRRARPWAAAGAAGLLAAAAPWSGAGGALPLVVATAVPLGVVLIDSLAGVPVAERPHPLLRAALGVPVLVATLVGALFLPISAPALPHTALASWISDPVAPTAPVAVPASVWPDLLRDGVPRDRLRAPGADTGSADEWVVLSGEVPAEDRARVVARFGTGGGTLTVLGPTSDAPPPDVAQRELAARQALGAQLAGNPRLEAPESVTRALRQGGVDSRVLMVLAGLLAQHGVTVESLPAMAGEDPAVTPPHALVLTALDGRPVTSPAVAGYLDRWFAAQLDVLAAAHTGLAGTGYLAQWSLPAPLELLGR